LKVVEGFFQVRDEVATLSKFYHDVTDINLKFTPYLLFEAKLHTTLIFNPRVLQFKWHFYVAKTAEGSDERGGGLVCLGEEYLVITRVGIQETQKLTSGREIYDLVKCGEGKMDHSNMPCLGSCSQHTSFISHSFLVQEPDLLSSPGVGLLW
jgi:hypothetical protein